MPITDLLSRKQFVHLFFEEKKCMFNILCFPHTYLWAQESQIFYIFLSKFLKKVAASIEVKIEWIASIASLVNQG